MCPVIRSVCRVHSPPDCYRAARVETLPLSPSRNESQRTSVDPDRRKGETRDSGAREKTLNQSTNPQVLPNSRLRQSLESGKVTTPFCPRSYEVDLRSVQSLRFSTSPLYPGYPSRRPVRHIESYGGRTYLKLRNSDRPGPVVSAR